MSTAPPPTPPPFQPTRFGRYLLTDRIAVGGMAEIFRAKSFGVQGFEKQLAIKRILPHLAADPSFLGMFIDEAKLAVHLSHPNIVQVFELGEVEGQFYIAMEFVDGIDALHLLRACAQRHVRIPVHLAVHLVMEVLQGLDYAHSAVDDRMRPLGIVHRDISPSNVLLSYRGSVKLSDFGVARAEFRTNKTQAGMLKGKYGYMAPEQVLGRPIDRRADLFTCGIVLAELTTGRRLFPGRGELEVLLRIRDVKLDVLERHGGHLPEPLKAILHKALARDVRQRYQDAIEFHDALGQFLFDRRERVNAAKVAALLRELGYRPSLPAETTDEIRLAAVRAEAHPASHEIVELVADEPPDGPGDPHLDEDFSDVEDVLLGSEGGGSAQAEDEAAPGLLGEVSDVSRVRGVDSGLNGPVQSVVSAVEPGKIELVMSAPVSPSAPVERAQTPPAAEVRTLEPSGVDASFAGPSAADRTPRPEESDSGLRAARLEARGGRPRRPAAPNPMELAVLEAAGDTPVPSHPTGDVARFRIRALDGTVLGPLTGDGVVEQLRAGKIDGTEQVSVGDQPFVPIRQASEVADVLVAAGLDFPIGSRRRTPTFRPGRETAPSAPAAASAPVAVSGFTEPPPAAVMAAMATAAPPPRAPAARETAAYGTLAPEPPIPAPGANPQAPFNPPAQAGSGLTKREGGSDRLKPPATVRPPEPRRTEVADFAGRIGEVSPAKLFYRFAIARENGLLMLEAGAVVKEIYLVNGSPQHVSSNVAQELLGEYLVARKVISRMELEMALAMLPRFGGKIGDTLIGLNLIRPLDLFRHLTQQVRDKLLDVFGWQRGEYHFYRGLACAKEVFPLGLDAFEIISAGIGSIPREELLAWFDSIAGRPAMVADAAPVRPEDFKLGAAALDLYGSLDGRRPLGELIGLTRDPDEARRALYLFVECELVHVVTR